MNRDSLALSPPMGQPAATRRHDARALAWVSSWNGALILLGVVFVLRAFQANAQICTQDGPLIAVWVALTAIGLRLVRRWNERENTWREWMLLWFVLGIGCLFKQSVVLFLPSLFVYWIARRTLPI